MTPINKALQDVKHQIPPQILELVFTPTQQRYVSSYSGAAKDTTIDATITEKVIEGRVRSDCDLLGGAEAVLNVSGMKTTYIDDYAILLNIPDRLTEGRKITSVIALSYGGSGGIADSGYTNNHANIGDSAMLSAAKQVMASQRPQSVNQTTQLSLVGHNTVLVENNTHLRGDMYLRCIVSNDSEFTNIKAPSVPHFSKLVTLATKAYIYNVFLIEMGRGQLYNGQELGVVQDIVSGYADANEMYNEYLQTKWRKISLMNDDKRWGRFIRLQSGGML